MSCFVDFKQKHPDVYSEVVNRNDEPIMLLLKDAMKKRNLIYEPELKMEGNCQKLLQHLGLRMELEELEQDQELQELQKLLEKEPEEIKESMEVETILGESRRPPMTEPDFLIPIVKRLKKRKYTSTVLEES